MRTCTACQEFAYRDRLERARRFAWWRRTGVLLSATGMREFLKEGIPEFLQKEVLEPFFVTTEVGRPLPRARPSATVSRPQELFAEPRRSLRLGGLPALDVDVDPGGAHAAFVDLASPQRLEEAQEEEPQGSSDRVDILSRELKEQREEAARDRQRFADLFATMQASLEKLASQPSASRRATCTLEALPSTTAEQRVDSWKVPARPDRVPTPSISGESWLSETILPNVGQEVMRSRIKSQL
jgi:hypothetical protein